MNRCARVRALNYNISFKDIRRDFSKKRVHTHIYTHTRRKGNTRNYDREVVE